jgi:mannose-6-phosphate isomerase-like protein (cupin superfamily)
MPNVEGQLVAKDMGKYQSHSLQRPIKAGQPIFRTDVEVTDSKATVNSYYKQIKDLLTQSQILLPKNIYLEISHHYGLTKFLEYGAAMIHLINRDYSKIVMVMLPGQKYPQHMHITKDETYYIVHGCLSVEIDGANQNLTPGQTFSVPRGSRHSFSTLDGVVFEEIATRYIQGDSCYTDETINANNKRKTLVPL